MLHRIYNSTIAATCVALCAAANLIGIMPKERVFSVRTVERFDGLYRYAHGWPIVYMERDTQDWPIPFKDYELWKKGRASRLPFDGAPVIWFNRFRLALDMIATSAVAAFAIGTVVAASRVSHITTPRISAAWAFLSTTTVASILFAIHGEHADWVFFRWRALIPYDDLAMAFVAGIGLAHLPRALEFLTSGGQKRG